MCTPYPSSLSSLFTEGGDFEKKRMNITLTRSEAWATKHIPLLTTIFRTKHTHTTNFSSVLFPLHYFSEEVSFVSFSRFRKKDGPNPRDQTSRAYSESLSPRRGKEGASLNFLFFSSELLCSLLEAGRCKQTKRD